MHFLSDKMPESKQSHTAAPSLHLEGTAYVGGQYICGPVTLDIPGAHWTCLLGSSGVGKSTLLKILSGIDTHTSFQGHLRTSDGKPVLERSALMTQDDLLMPWLNLVDNITLGSRLRGETIDHEAVETILKHTGTLEHAQKKPHALSGGQRQRAALGRTLLENKPIVFLDEPFSSLDACSRMQMQNLAASLLQGRTVLHVTHDPAEAVRMAHKILLLSSERVTEIFIQNPPPPRSTDSPETICLQADLLNQLMESMS